MSSRAGYRDPMEGYHGSHNGCVPSGKKAEWRDRSLYYLDHAPRDVADFCSDVSIIGHYNFNLDHCPDYYLLFFLHNPIPNDADFLKMVKDEIKKRNIVETYDDELKKGRAEYLSKEKHLYKEREKRRRAIDEGYSKEEHMNVVDWYFRELEGLRKSELVRIIWG